ncbi:MAG: DNA-binding response regulator [Bacteroidetes bacterium]|nr:MAG: DNA-binding response regulator [Bacteroidota bacterium]
MLRAIAIDDEPLALEVIQRFAGKTPSLELIATFENPIAAAEFLQQEVVDLVFLDIQMPDLSGIQFLQTIAQRPLVIFTTAYSQYAVNSYELDAVDYLLKPILFDRFMKAVNKALRQYAAQQGGAGSRSEEGDESGHDYLFIKSDTRYFKVNHADILYIEGMRDYIAVHTPKQKILTLMSMTNMLKRLPDEDFMRVHKSYIIGLNHITLIQHNRVLIGEREIPISNSYKEAFLAFVESRTE